MIRSNLNQESKFPAEHRSDEGFYLDDLAEGAVLDIETQHHYYRLVKGAGTHVRISGHPAFCPEPVEVEVEGSVRSMPPLTPHRGLIGRGMYLLYKHPRFHEIITSRIREIHKLE